MARIFISYRRDDTAGHSGRLADHLTRHFGESEIFRDIEHIAPGRDFVEAIEQEVGSCDILIAVIGRLWLTISDAQGQRRLDNPDDFVRLELSTALARNIRVIPVLVQGASMPSPDDLPEQLMGLARRNALELRDTSWSSDVERLIGVLEDALYAHGSLVTRRLVAEETPEPHQLQSTAPIAVAAAPRRRAPLWRTCLFIAIPVVVLICVATGLFATNLRSRFTTDISPTAVVVVDDTIDAPFVEPTSAGVDRSASGGSRPGSLILPAGAEVTVGDATYTILSAWLDNAATGKRALTFEIRMTNKSIYGRNLWGESARLSVDGALLAPTETPNITVAGFSAEEGDFAFTVPDTLQKAELQLGQVGEETAIVPVDLTAGSAVVSTPTVDSPLRTATYPLALPAGAEVTVGEATYTILSARLDKAATGKLALAIEIRKTNKSIYGSNLWGDSARLLVDDVPRAPTDMPNVTVAGFSADEGTFVFTVPDTIQKAELQLGQVGEDTTIVPIDLAAGSAIAPTPAAGSRGATANYPLELPAGAEVTVGEVTYTILSARLDKAATGKLALTFEIPMTNKSIYGRNLWGDSARLLVDGVLRAPTEMPNVTVAGSSTGEGSFVFTVPDTLQKVELQLGQVGEDTMIIPIDL